MKKIKILILSGLSLSFLLSFNLTAESAKICDITIQSRWQNLETPREMSFFNSKWILAATITFKRTSTLKEPIFINRLQFSWTGPILKSLNASLFKKTPNQPFTPVEEMVISDGKWNARTQELHFAFNDQQRLDPVTTFYIVITIPSELEQSISQGKFTLVPSCLPDELQQENWQLAQSFTVTSDILNNSLQQNFA